MTSRGSQVTQIFTQAVQTVHAGVINALRLKPNAQVPEIRVKYGTGENNSYPLLGDRYIIGRSSKDCDIQVRNPVVSQVHCVIEKNQQNGYTVRDEGSTNGVFYGKRRLTKPFSLRHGDIITLGPPELQDAVEVEYYNPPPLWAKGLRYSLYGTSGIMGLLAVIIGIEWLQVPVRPLPKGISGPVVVYSEDGKTNINPQNNDVHRELDNLSDFSPYLPQAVIASEDSRYYWHLGADPIGILRAILVNTQKDQISQGGSTITQQLARSLFTEVGRENTAERKLREISVALKLEMFYSKNEILKTYLNRVYLGVNSYGFEDAAQFYFEKSAADLTLAEAATLVGILPAPNAYNPVQNYDTAVQQRDRVINRMVRLGYITEEEAEDARRSRIIVSEKAKKTLSQAIGPYYYSYVLDELTSILGETKVREGNWIVETGLNPEYQQQAEAAIKQTINTYGTQYNISQGALVTLDATTGEIRALVGGYDYTQSQFNRASQAQRQPGSTFKVFAYAAALEQGISPRKAYSCASFFWKGQSFEPCKKHTGLIDMYPALAHSENVVALRLAQDVGLEKVVQMAKRLGITSKLAPIPGLVLGQKEVNVLEITGAYATFANEGIWNHPHAIKRVLDGNDCQDYDNPKTCRVVYSFSEEKDMQKKVISAEIAATMTDLMQGVIQYGTGTPAYLAKGEAGKTGTTNNYVDLWFIGYLPQENLVTGIWLGNDDNSPTRSSSGQAAALWGNYMREITN